MLNGDRGACCLQGTLGEWPALAKNETMPSQLFEFLQFLICLSPSYWLSYLFSICPFQKELSCCLTSPSQKTISPYSWIIFHCLSFFLRFLSLSLSLSLSFHIFKTLALIHSDTHIRVCWVSLEHSEAASVYCLSSSESERLTFVVLHNVQSSGSSTLESADGVTRTAPCCSSLSLSLHTT